MIPKYKAWDKDCKEMHDVERIYLDTECIYFKNGIRSLNTMQEYGFWQNFDTFELMQYTGLKDRNGIEIYEGYLLRVSDLEGDSYIGIVKNYADEGYPAFDIECPNGWHYESNILSTISQSGYQEMEVIGNIYENPELLEVKQ